MRQEFSDTDMVNLHQENAWIDLQPIWEMLLHHKRELSAKDWIHLVEQAKAGVVRHPTEYLNTITISQDAFDQLIDKLFNEFIYRSLNQEDKIVKSYKRKFDRALRHVKVSLIHKKDEMPPSEWEVLVSKTILSVLNNPEEFFCFELPAPELTTAAIVQVFEGFRQDQKVRAIQSNQLVSRNLNADLPARDLPS
jgi:hypothetical protein